MQNNTAQVISLKEARFKRTAEQRRLRNQQFAEALMSRWFDTDPASGRTLFVAIAQKAVNGPIATPERAAILLPIFLEVLDEMDNEQEAQSDAN